MSNEEPADASDEPEDGTAGASDDRGEELAETAGDAFRDVYEPGPRVDTSSRSLDEDVSAAESNEVVTMDEPGGEATADGATMDGTNDPVTDESSADDSEQTTVTDGADEPVPDEVDADHTRDLEGDAADTTPIDEIELDVDEPVSPDEVESAGPGAGTENRSTGGSEAATDDESGGIFGWLRSLLFGG